MKLGTHAHYITPTTMVFPRRLHVRTQNRFFKGSTYGDENWYARVFQHVHDNYMFVSKITSSILKLVNGNTHGDETQYACVSHRFHDDNIVLTTNRFGLKLTNGTKSVRARKYTRVVVLVYGLGHFTYSLSRTRSLRVGNGLATLLDNMRRRASASRC